jgi:hypothetical protein
MATTMPLGQIPQHLKGASLAKLKAHRDPKIGKKIHPISTNLQGAKAAKKK